MKIEEHPGSITIESEDITICLTYEEAYSCLEWLWERRDKLRGKDDELNAISDILTITDEERLHLLIQQGMLTRYGTREEIATWREVIAEEREQAARHANAQDAPARDEDEAGYAAALKRSMSVLPEQAPQVDDTYEELAQLWHEFMSLGPTHEQMVLDRTGIALCFSEWMDSDPEEDPLYGLPEILAFFDEKERREGSALARAMSVLPEQAPSDPARDEIVTWREVIAEERERAARHDEEYGEPPHPDTTEKDYQAFRDEHAAQIRLAYEQQHGEPAPARDEQDSRVRRYNAEMDARMHSLVENREKPWLPVDPGAASAESFQESAEPWLEDCPHCKGAHMLGTVDMCPLNPNRPEWVKHLEESE